MGAHLFDRDATIDQRLNRLANTAILLTIGILSLIYLKGVIQPFIIALMVFFLLQPGVSQLQKRGIPTLPSYLLVVTGFTVLVGLAGWWLYSDLSKVVELLPGHMENVQSWMDRNEGKTIFGITISFGGIGDSLSGDAVRGVLLSMFGEVGSFLSEVLKRPRQLDR